MLDMVAILVLALRPITFLYCEHLSASNVPYSCPLFKLETEKDIFCAAF